MAVDSKILAELVESVKAGDADSFEKLYNLTFEDYSRYARFYLKNSEDVEDVMQQCYMNLYSYIGNLQKPENFKAWFSAIVRNECFKKLNVGKKHNITFDNYIYNDSTNNEEIAIQESFDEKSDMFTDVRQAVEELSDEQKSCVILYYYENKKASDVAKELGITEAAVKSRLHKSKKILEKKLDAYRTASVTGISIAISYLLFRAGKESISKSKQAAIWSTVSTAASANSVVAGTLGASAVVTAETAGVTGTTVSAIGSSAIVKGVSVLVAASVVASGGAVAYKFSKSKNITEQSITSEVISSEYYENTNAENVLSDYIESVTELLSDYSEKSDEIINDSSNVSSGTLASVSADNENKTTALLDANNISENQSTTATFSRVRTSTTKSTDTYSRRGTTKSELTNDVNSTSKTNSRETTDAVVTTKSTTTARDSSANFGINSGIISSYSGTDSSVSIPSKINGSTVTAIGKNAFEGNKGLKSVSMPSGVKQIGQQAFAECTSLSSVSLPTGLETIGLGAFYGCSSLKSVSIPSGTKSIGDNAFAECTALTTVTIPDSVTNIGDDAFVDCSSSLTIKCSKDSAAYNYAVENGIKYQLT